MANGMVRNVCFYYRNQPNLCLPFQYQTAIDLTITITSYSVWVLQMLAARKDLCEVFFEMKSYQRMALIKQSEKVQARMKMREGRKVCCNYYYYSYVSDSQDLSNGSFLLVLKKIMKIQRSTII